jgi:sugar phosphate isomerase/epimerase
MKIGCSSYSLRKEFTEGTFKWNIEDFKKIKTKYPDLIGWELLADQIEQYWSDIEISDLKKLKSDLESTGFEWFAITTGSGAFGAANDQPHWVDDETYRNGYKRADELSLGYTMDWVENAAALGISLMRIDCLGFQMNHKINYSDAFAFNVDRNISLYKSVCGLGNEHGIKIGIENHGGFASDPKVLRKLFDAVPDLYLTFDTGNISDKERFNLLSDYAERINFLHAKFHVFNAAGDEAYIDFARILGMLKDKGFDGWLSIEFEGPSDGITGTEKSIAVLKKYM